MIPFGEVPYKTMFDWVSMDINNGSFKISLIFNWFPPEILSKQIAGSMIEVIKRLGISSKKVPELLA
jgi:hypothetical protein